MSRRPSNAALIRYLDGEPVAEVESWLDANTCAAAELDAVLSPPNAEPVPEFVGDYRIKRKLGEGGMGVVYLAHHERLGRDVAVKVIHPRWASEPGFQTRFVREGKLLAKVKDAHVVAVHDAGECDGQPFLVMEYAEGIDFEQWRIANGGRNLVANLFWVAEHVLTGLASIHGAGLIHRDIKPSNLCVANGTVKIIDFGVATHDGKKTVHAGTTAYMAPEVTAGAEATAKSDLYSAGVVLYELATGKRVGAGKQPEDERAFRELPPGLRGFVLGLLVTDPVERPASARAALAKLTAIRDRKPPTNPWVWLTVGLSATLGVLITGWLLAQAHQSRIVDRIRATEAEIDRAFDELSEAVKEIAAADAIHLLNGKADAVPRRDAAVAFKKATDKYENAKTRIDDARRTRADLLDRLTSSAER